MPSRFAVAFALAQLACSAAIALHPDGPVPPPLPPPPPPLSATAAPPPPPPACPGDVHGSVGRACTVGGQACRDDALPGLFGIVCTGGVWVAGEMPHPPCCKK